MVSRFIKLILGNITSCKLNLNVPFKNAHMNNTFGNLVYSICVESVNPRTLSASPGYYCH